MWRGVECDIRRERGCTRNYEQRAAVLTPASTLRVLEQPARAQIRVILRSAPTGARFSLDGRALKLNEGEGLPMALIVRSAAHHLNAPTARAPLRVRARVEQDGAVELSNREPEWRVTRRSEAWQSAKEAVGSVILLN